jgi:phage recombination protein Bet
MAEDDKPEGGMSTAERTETPFTDAIAPSRNLVRANVQVDGVARVEDESYNAWSKNQIELIKRTVAKDCSNSELYLFLTLASRYQLDPFVGEIYAVKMPGKDGGTGKMQPIVARGGMLKIANRHPAFTGMKADAVYDKDEFRRSPEGVSHSYGNPALRGALVGAWALAKRADRPDGEGYFFAYLAKYKPTKVGFHSPWGSTDDAMIIKCAQATALRYLFDVSGVYAEEEMDHAFQATVPQQVEDASVALEWSDDPERATRAAQLFETLNDAKPGACPPGKQRVLLRGATDPDARDALLSRLEGEIVAAGGEVPAVIVDAEIVSFGNDEEPPVGWTPDVDESIPFDPDYTPDA